MLYILDACENLCLEPWSDIGKTPIKRLHHGGFINLQVIIIVRNITFIWPLKTLNINVERWIVWVQRQRGIAKFTRIAMKGIHRMLKKKITLKGKITWILLSLAENPPPLPQAINNDRSLTLTKKFGFSIISRVGYVDRWLNATHQWELLNFVFLRAKFWTAKRLCYPPRYFYTFCISFRENKQSFALKVKQ